jgi:copper(I)-binding protein
VRPTRSLILLLSASLTLAACTAASDASTDLGIDDVRSRMSPRLAGVAAVYLDIDNPTDQDDALIAASVPADVAGHVELHETYAVDDDMADEPAMGSDEGMDGEAAGDMHGGAGDEPAMGSEEGMDDDMDGDGMDGEAAGGGHGEGGAMMAMREVPAIDVPAGSRVELAPGGLHLMLFDLLEDLQAGDTFELTLVFENAGEVTVTAEVRDDI